MATDERTYKVDVLSRVEGEGRFKVTVRDGQVVDAELAIFEAPRFFEAFLRGRSVFEVPDVVARICGICPVAYQMSAVRAIEGAFGVTPTAEIRALRRLLYCGEWIESHALHVFMLHAPDFLGYPSAVEMARDHKALVELGLAIKKTGNRVIEVLGGRAIHPIGVVVGGWSKAPTVAELRALRPELDRALALAVQATEWTATLAFPELRPDPVLVALGGETYPMEWADVLRVSGRSDVPVPEWEAAFVETHVERSNALQCRLADGTPYLTGPTARWVLMGDRIHPEAARIAAKVGLSRDDTNPYRSIVVRCVETVHALATAIDLVDAYAGAKPAALPVTPRDAVGFGATEAPRGVCWHRYDLRADGTVAAARIVPPTSQNQARIEADLRALAPSLLPLSHEAATLRCEQLIRSYDPCISCATHFLELDIDRGGAA